MAFAYEVQVSEPHERKPFMIPVNGSIIEAWDLADAMIRLCEEGTIVKVSVVLKKI